MVAPPRCSFSFAVHQTFSLGPLYSDGPLSSGRHREGVTETSLLARTQGRTLDRIFNSYRLVLLWAGFNDLWRRCRKACASLCRRESCNRTAVTSEVTSPTPVGGLIQPESWRKAGTHWLSVGKDTGGRIGNIGRMLGPESLVDAPTALCECWGQGLDPRAGTPSVGDQRKELAGDRPKHRRAPTQDLVLLSCTRSSFSIASVSALALQRTFTVRGRGTHLGSCWSLRTISACLFGHYGFPCVVFCLPLSPHLLVVSLLVCGAVSF